MKKISIIIPAYNEEKNIIPIYKEIAKAFDILEAGYIHEIFFINDGSVDTTAGEIKKLVQKDKMVKYIEFSRNFGKEMATSAGLNHCSGDACIMIDADSQHPAELISEFIKKWEQGFEVVIGVRKKSKSDSWPKKLGSQIFYKILNKISDIEVVPGSTDFRLLDRKVINEFNRFTETNRMTRGLIDWLGFKRSFIYFEADDRLNGTANYGFWELVKLAMVGFVSLSFFPLKLAGYFGVLISSLSGIAGLYILIGKYIFHLKFASTFSDAENLAIFIVFLVGIILTFLGLISLYIANIHSEVVNRPMYVVREKEI
ncbi:MAG TPA: glycosyltransferase family 2 protein [Candidatus Moranbacteria bacterium]|nr:glycosyltransferase family 2 protein [Candidatus Moranbacteria bacterium]